MDDGKQFAVPVRSEKHQQIIEAAQRLFTESGYGKISMDAIAAAANVSKRTVYFYFESKEELFSAVMQNKCMMLAQGLGVEEQSCGDDKVRAEVYRTILGFDEEGDPRVILKRIGCGFLQMLLDPNSAALFRAIVAEADRFPEIGRSFFENGPATLHALLKGLFEEWERCGALKFKDTDRASWTLMTLLAYPEQMMVAVGLPTKDFTEDYIEKKVDAVLEEFLAMCACQSQQCP